MSARTSFVLAFAAFLALASPASAARVETIAAGLDNPRHLALGGDEIYVAEAGRGGAAPCFPGLEGPMAPPNCVGATGAVTVVSEHGDQRTLVGNLASFAVQGSGAEAIGPHGIYLKGKKLYFTNGGPAEADRDALAAQNPVADLFGRLLTVKRHGRLSRIADVWRFERDNNPDAQIGEPAVDSNPVDVLVDHGRFVVADAGGNTLLKAKKNGAISVLSVFGNRPAPNPFGPGDIPMQTVPTGVVKGPGDYFMSQLTGFPFQLGAAKVYRVDRKSGAATVFASGFTNIMDLAFDRDGTLWVLEIDHDGLLGGSPDGAIFAVDRGGRKEPLQLPPGTLTHPGGIAVGDDGDLYVTNNADTAGNGQVLRIDVQAQAPPAGEPDEDVADDDDADDADGADEDDGDRSDRAEHRRQRHHREDDD